MKTRPLAVLTPSRRAAMDAEANQLMQVIRRSDFTKPTTAHYLRCQAATLLNEQKILGDDYRKLMLEIETLADPFVDAKLNDIANWWNNLKAFERIQQIDTDTDYTRTPFYSLPAKMRDRVADAFAVQFSKIVRISTRQLGGVYGHSLTVDLEDTMIRLSGGANGGTYEVREADGSLVLVGFPNMAALMIDAPEGVDIRIALAEIAPNAILPAEWPEGQAERYTFALGQFSEGEVHTCVELTLEMDPAIVPTRRQQAVLDALPFALAYASHARDKRRISMKVTGAAYGPKLYVFARAEWCGDPRAIGALDTPTYSLAIGAMGATVAWTFTKGKGRTRTVHPLYREPYIPQM